MIKKTQMSKDLGKTCRACLNSKYHLHLTSRNCHYMGYSFPCESCHMVRHIVLDLRWTAGPKLLFGRAPATGKRKEMERGG